MHPWVRTIFRVAEKSSFCQLGHPGSNCRALYLIWSLTSTRQVVQGPIPACKEESDELHSSNVHSEVKTPPAPMQQEGSCWSPTATSLSRTPPPRLSSPLPQMSVYELLQLVGMQDAFDSVTLPADLVLDEVLKISPQVRCVVRASISR
jgi:hypothetical protein